VSRKGGSVYYPWEAGLRAHIAEALKASNKQREPLNLMIAIDWVIE